MFIRKTISLKQKKVSGEHYGTIEKKFDLYCVTIYWFLFIPVYRYEEFLV